MARVVLDHVSKMFMSHGKEVVAVKDITLEIENGEFFALLGPSGSGKSTLLRLIAGLEIPTSGDIIIDDKIVTHLPPKERDVAMVFQSYALYPHMTVYDNIAFPLKIRKIAKEQIDKRVKEVAKMLNIAHLLDRKPGELSGGEMQRVALARALVREPKVFLLDEPLSNLDAKLRVVARAYLRRLQKELGVTTIYVTHDQAEAMTLADRIGVLSHGVLQQVGAPLEIYKRPVNVFVAGFIGSPPMNFIKGSLIEKNSKFVFDAGSFRLELPEDLSTIVKNHISSSEVILGIRPDDAYAVPITREDHIITGTVYVTETLGNIQYIAVQIDPDLVIRVIAPIELMVNIGDKVGVNLDIRKIYLFDAKTERALL